jgi:hypothetical protein
VIVTQSGERKDLGNIKTDDAKAPVRFSTPDGDRFVAAVVARKKELGIP